MIDTVLLSYRMEYENTDISIEDLKTKYTLTEADIQGNKHWKKPPSTPPQTNSTKSNIESFKVLVVEKALEYIECGLRDPKELKDLVTIVDTIEKSYGKPETTTPTINILVQNLVEKYKDDC